MTDRGAPHPPDEVLGAFLEGRLGVRESAAVEEHLLDCPSCCDSLAARPGDTDAFLSRVRAALEPSPDPTLVRGGAPPMEIGWPSVPGYEVVGVLGRGGMGVVYEARQLGLNRTVALKMVSAGRHASPEDLARFRGEAQAAARLQHPNIVQIYEVGSHDGLPYFAMEYVGGGDLRGLLSGAPLPPAPAAHLAEQLASAAAHAHERGVVHRDLKPANVLLASGGRQPPDENEPSRGSRPPHAEIVPRITDFGLAKWLDQDRGLTHTGTVAGTPGYMAPEQAGAAGSVGPLADVYALGAILYECLTGRPPFVGATSLEILEQVRQREPVPPARLAAGVPRDLETICLKCLEKDPRRRYPSAAALADDLHRYRAGEPIWARPAGRLTRAWKWARRRPAVAALLAAVVLVTALGLGGVTAALLHAVAGWDEADAQRAQAGRERDDARAARDDAQAARTARQRQSAALLLDRGLGLARGGNVADGLHWMAAALEASPDDEFRRLVRTHLASWAARSPTLTHWLDTPHRNGAFSHGGALFASAGRSLAEPDRRQVTIQFWDLNTGEPRGAPLLTDQIGIGSLSFSPDDATLLAVSSTPQEYQYRPGWAARWRVADGAALGKSQGHRDTVEHALWLPDGKTFVTASWDHTVRRWDGATGAAVGQPLAVPATQGAARLPAVSPDGRWLLAASGRGVRVWDLTTGAPATEPLPVEGGSVESVAFAPDGRELWAGLLAPGGKGRLVWSQRWDSEKGAPVGRPSVTPHPTGVVAVLSDGRPRPEPGASPDGAWMFRRRDGTQLWRAARGLTLDDPRPAPTAPVVPATFSADGTRAWVALARNVQAWDLAGGCPVGAAVPHGSGARRFNVAVSPNGKWVAALLPDLGIKAGVQLHGADGQPVGQVLPQRNAVLAMTFSPDSSMLATGGHFGSADLWAVPSGKPLVQVAQGFLITALAFSPDGKVLAVGDIFGTVRLWDISLWMERTAALKQDEAIERLVFSPDGRRLLVQGKAAAHLWDAAGWEKVGVLAPASVGGEVQALFSPDASMVLTGHGGGSFRLWDARTGRALGRPTPDDRAEATCFAFSLDGRLVLSGHRDGTAQVWDVPTSLPLGAPAAQPLGVAGVAFLPGGKSFVTVAAGGAPRVWPVPAPLEGDTERITLALQLGTGLRLDESRAVVPLTRAEWEALRARWKSRYGVEDWRLVAAAPEAQWHDARAADAEQSGQAFTAAWHLERLAQLRPDDWRVAARVGDAAAALGDATGAEHAYARARALGGAAVSDWQRHRLEASGEAGAWAAQCWYLTQLLSERPKDWVLLGRRAVAHVQQGLYDRAEADQTRALEMGANVYFPLWMAEQWGVVGDLKRTAAMYQRAARSGLKTLDAVGKFALVSLALGDEAAFRKLCQAALTESQRPGGAPAAGGVAAWLAGMGKATEDYGPLIEQAEILARKPQPDAARRHLALATLGAVYYRGGRHRDAVAALTQALELDGGAEPVSTWAMLAMAEHALGRHAEARRWLDRALTVPLPQPGRQWWEAVEADMLRREAERLMARVIRQ